LLTILVVLFHLMITYAGTGSWYYTEGREDFVTGALGAWFLTVNQAYFMGLFLLISAYFVPGSYDRKGAGRFLKDRLIRLGIPLALYSLIIRPLLAYLDPVRFPDGRPADPPTEGEEDSTNETTQEVEPGLTESVNPGTVILVMDTDWLLDSYSVRRMNFLGMTALEPLNDNLSFGSSSVEYLGGSEDLISIRSKGTTLRPFKVVQNMEVAAQQRYQAELEEVDARLREVQNQLSQLASQQTEGRRLVASPEIQESLEEYRAQEASVRAERRKIRKALREGIERLGTILLLSNLLIVPVFVGLFGVAFFIRRNRRQKD